MRSSAINKANKATSTQLEACILTSRELNGARLHFVVKTSSELSDVERERIWNIFESNMHLFYTTSSFGWNPRSKKEEMFHSHARLVLCSESIPSEFRIVAYTIFRFEREAKQDVVYWLETPSSSIEKSYELQVTEESRGLGVGKLLMGSLFDIGSRWRMKNVMLTVFKVANSAASAFYRSLGFDLDSSSPGYAEEGDWQDEELDCDYVILSKSIP
ncbi:acyl-CoA N-acyltransferase [Suillus subaureus]|uniref:N-alpha-acetyltransferase 40 n=1 Tax=Suillus subaureus TaxID=48587 RepID=A0A9P7EN45_9AGAM|nr:acyl-CoA N-acyltransferase [Suillus subaureus]KAG1826006.1 acyl-CoA N-acyltransferase [Suillus subaureus]